MRTRRLAIGAAAGVALAAAIGGGALFLLDEPAAAPDAGIVAAARAAEPMPSTEAAGSIARSGEEAAPADGPGASRDMVVAHRPPSPGLTLVFVERETSRPLPDAAVWLVREADVDAATWHGFGLFDPECDAAIEQAGRPLELDALATVTLEREAASAMVFATAGERRLRRELELDATERHVLRLVRREALTLVAVDPDGRRQPDVPLSLQSIRRGDPWRGRAQVRWLATTDRDGEASAPHGSELLDEHLDDDGLATVRVLAAALAFPCRDPAAELVDPRGEHRSVVALVTPPRSILDVRAVDPKGAPIDVAFVVRASAIDAVRKELPLQRAWEFRIPAGGGCELLTEAEIALQLEAWSEDGFYGPLTTRVRAPGRATSEPLLLTFERNERAATPGARAGQVLVTRGGTPLASSDVGWQIDGGDMPIEGRMQLGRTDAAGILHFEHVAPSDAGASRRRRNRERESEPTLHVFDGFGVPLSRGAARHGSAELQVDPGPGVLDAGTIELLDVPRLVDGRVVDAEGQGLADVRIEIRERSSRRERPTIWVTPSGPDGRFFLHATTEAPVLHVWPAREHWYRENEYETDGARRPIAVAAGERDLEIVLRRKGFARGRILVDAGISLRDFTFDVLPKPAPAMTSRLDEDGRFVVEDAPSRRSIRVNVVPGMSEPLRQIDGVDFVEGRETIDSRLDPIDLRGELRQIELLVLRDHDGSPVADAMLFLTRNRGVLAAPRASDPFGRVLLTTSTFDSALGVGAADTLIELAQFDRTHQEIRVGAAIAVRVRVEGDVARLLGNERFRASFALSEATGGPLVRRIWEKLPRPEAVRFTDDTLEFRATALGSYELQWHFESRDRWRPVRRSTPVHVGGGAVVDVVEKFTDDEARAVLSSVRR